MTLSATSVALIVGSILPIGVGLILRVLSRWASPHSRTLKLAVQTAAATLVGLIVHGTLNDGSAFISWGAFYTAWLAWANSMATYLGIYAKIDLNDRLLGSRGE